MKNPYQQLYKNFNFKIDNCTCSQQAQLMLQQLGFLYNTIALVIKDISKLLSLKFPIQHSNEVISNQSNNLTFLANLQNSPNKIYQDFNTKNIIISQQQQIVKQILTDHYDNLQKPSNQSSSPQGFNSTEQQIKNDYIYSYNGQNNLQIKNNQQTIQEIHQIQLLTPKFSKQNVIQIDD